MFAVCAPVLMRLCVRHVLCWLAFPLVFTLRSTGSVAVGSAADCSAADRSTLFVGFTATMAESDFSCPCVIGYGSLALITSSARCCRNQGTSRPRALAVLRLITSSNFVGNSTADDSNPKPNHSPSVVERSLILFHRWDVRALLTIVC